MGNLNNSDWEVKDNKVRIGNEWKDKKQLQTSFIIELALFIATVGLCIWAFTTNIIFGVVTLFVALFFLALAIGSLSTLKAIGAKIDLNFFSGASKKAADMTEKVVHKASAENYDIEYSFQATLGKTSSDDAQEIIQTLVIDGLFDVNEDYDVITQRGRKLGELTPSSVAKLKDYDKFKKKCKVVSVGENKTGKKTVKVEILVVK